MLKLRILLIALLIWIPMSALADNSGAGQQVSVKVTCYAPGAGGRIEGPFATSRPGPTGGQSVPKTLDDFRLGRSNYVTLAANPSRYTQWFDMGTITYVSNLDSRQYTIEKVVGYVHDTGCAFKVSGESGSCCAKYNTCSDAIRKFDIAYGDFRNGLNVGLVNSSPICRSVNTMWLQIGGPLTAPPVVTAGPYVSGYMPGVATVGPGFSGAGQSGVAPASMFTSQGVQNPSALGALQSSVVGSNNQYGGNVNSIGTTGETSTGFAASSIIVQPSYISRGKTVIVSWTTVNMAPNSCAVLLQGEQFAVAQQGTKPLRTVSIDPQELTFTLRCTDISGRVQEKNASVTLQ